jgi:hypothetical protein
MVFDLAWRTSRSRISPPRLADIGCGGQGSDEIRDVPGTSNVLSWVLATTDGIGKVVWDAQEKTGNRDRNQLAAPQAISSCCGPPGGKNL